MSTFALSPSAVPRHEVVLTTELLKRIGHFFGTVRVEYFKTTCWSLGKAESQKPLTWSQFRMKFWKLNPNQNLENLDTQNWLRCDVLILIQTIQKSLKFSYQHPNRIKFYSLINHLYLIQNIVHPDRDHRDHDLQFYSYYYKTR